jgi:FMN phosphatase YigB (HAD superfamily)
MNPVIIFDFNRTLYDPDKHQLMPGAVELLQGAKAKGYVLLLLGKAAASRAQLMEELGINSYFAEVMLVEEKSDALFEGFAKRHSADKTRSYVIGDRAQGELKYGYRGGWRTIWLKAGKFADELPMADQQPNYIVDSLEKVLPLL